MKIIGLCLALLSPAAFAATPTFYNCHALVVSADLPNGSAEAQYKAIAKSETHGGQEYDYTFKNHQLAILSDAKWLSLTWTKDKAVVAEATTVRGEDNQTSVVLILKNPGNDEEQASVDCTVPVSGQ